MCTHNLPLAEEGMRVLRFPHARGATPAPPRRATHWVRRKSSLKSTAALLKSPWKKADVPSSWHLYFYFVQRWIWLSCLLIFPAFGACCRALLKMCLAGCRAACFPESPRDCRGEGLLSSAWLHHSFLLFASRFPPLTLFGLCFFSLYLCKSAWVSREQEGGDLGHW